MAEDMRSKLQQFLITKTDFLSKKDKLSEDDLRAFVVKTIDDLCLEQKIALPATEKAAIVREIVGAVVSLGPLRALVEDQSISEIMVNGPDHVYIQKRGHIELTPIKFDDSRHLLHVIQKMLSGSGSSRRVDESSPYVDFSWKDGSRVNVILPPCSLIGPVVTIRKFSSDIGRIEDLLKLKMLNEKMATFLIAAIKAKLNIVFCGATGTGKTTILNVLSKYIPQDERIITIEDTSELRLLQEHVVSLQSKAANIEGRGAISIRELFVNSLRMRPDRIILGEVRGEEALDMIQSITSGHTGSLAIIHAASPEDCFNRMVTMLLMSGIRLSTEEIKRQVASAVDLIVHVELFMDGRRRVTHITDFLYKQETDELITENIFKYEQQRINDNGTIEGDWFMSKKKPSFYDRFVKKNAGLPENFFGS